MISSRKANENKTLLTLSDTKMKSHNRLPGVPVKVLLENSFLYAAHATSYLYHISGEKMIKATAYPERSYKRHHMTSRWPYWYSETMKRRRP